MLKKEVYLPKKIVPMPKDKLAEVPETYAGRFLYSKVGFLSAKQCDAMVYLGGLAWVYLIVNFLYP
jgi:hypothetical protein